MRATSMRSRVALSLVVGLLTAVVSAQTAQTPDPLEDVLGRVAARVGASLHARPESPARRNDDDSEHRFGFSRRRASRACSKPTCGSSPTSWRATARTRVETRVVRDFRKVNGHQPRKKDDHDCLDPNPISPEPLAFLLPAQRTKLRLQTDRPGQGEGQPRDHRRVPRTGGGEPKVEERDLTSARKMVPEHRHPRPCKRAGVDRCLELRGDARRFVDRPRRLPVPDTKRRRIGMDAFAVLERLDTSIRYKPVPFLDPEETVILPESDRTR